MRCFVFVSQMGTEGWKYFSVTSANIANICYTSSRKIIEPDQNCPFTPSCYHLGEYSHSLRLKLSGKISRMGDAWACVQVVVPSSKQLESRLLSESFFSNLCFNSCMEARFVALTQLNLSRLSETFTKIIGFLTAVLDLAVSWKLTGGADSII